MNSSENDRAETEGVSLKKYFNVVEKRSAEDNLKIDYRKYQFFPSRAIRKPKKIRAG